MATYVQEMMEREIRELIDELGKYISHGEEPPVIEHPPIMYILLLFDNKDRKIARYMSNCEREDAATILENVVEKLRNGQVEKP